MRILLTLTLAVVVLPRVATAADTVVTYDGTEIKGTVLRLKDGRLELRRKEAQEPTQVALGDVSQVKLIPAPPDPKRHQSTLIIDNDGDHGPTEKSGKIKLKKGLHAFWLLFFQGGQGAVLDFKWAGPGIKKQKIPRNVLSKWKTNPSDVTFSSGLDEDGFRQPDEVDEPVPSVGYKLYEWTQNAAVSEAGDLRNLQLKKYGTVRQVGLNFSHTPTNFGATFYGLIKVPKDGEYTFFLNSDDGSQLYLGKAPPISQPTIRAAKEDEWLFELNDGARLHAKVLGWDAEGAHCAIKLGSTEVKLTVPPAELRELWSREYADKKAEVDRAGEPKDADTVYAKNKDGQIQRVSGTVLGITDESLKFDFQGQKRSIALERVAAVIARRGEPREDSDQRRIRILFDLCGPNQIVGHLTAMTPGSATIEVPWGETIKLSRNWIYKMIVLNGRMQSLGQVQPSEVVQTPFFDRMLNWQSGKSLTGGTLKIGERTYEKGLCLHSRTKLTYDLAGEYDRFQCDLGLQRPEGDAGNATVRILADGTELFVADEVTAAEEPHVLDLDLSGKERLTLEVDFGQGMHIGDHVVFGNARLLRPELAP